MIKYICNNCKTGIDKPCTIKIIDDLLISKHRCLVAADFSADFKKHIPDPVRMIRGVPSTECQDMPCLMKMPGRHYCVRHGDDCDTIHDTIDRYGIIVGMKIINDAMEISEADFDLTTLIQNSAEEITGTI